MNRPVLPWGLAVARHFHNRHDFRDRSNGARKHRIAMQKCVVSSRTFDPSRSMDSTELFETLCFADWGSNFDERTYSRGAAYAEQGRVLELVVDDSARDEVALTGRIRGSGQHVYRCRIEFEWGDDWLVLHSDCSCPVGVDCKHAAAMLQLGREQTLAQLDRTEAHSQAEPALFEQKLPPWLIALQARHPEVADADDLSAWERWLETLHADHAAYEQHNEQREFGVLLRAGDTGSAASPQLLACPAWLRPAKSRARHKSMVDPKTLTPDAQWGAVPTPPGGWPAEVAIALAALGPCRHTQIGALRWAWISSRHEEHALEQLLERYPVWYERGSQPIQRGPDLPLQIHWQADQRGNQHLAATLPDRALLLRGARLWYVDRQAGQFGHVQGDARLLDRIRYAPTLQPEHAAALRQRLRASGSATGLPVPSEFEPPATVRAKPVPTLHLRVETAPDWEASHRLAVARLTFDYKGAHLPPDQAAWPVVRHLHQGKLLDIHRDIATEADARKQLGALDFVTIRELYQFRFKSDQCEPGELVVRPLAHRPPLSPEACRSLPGHPRTTGRGRLPHRLRRRLSTRETGRNRGLARRHRAQRQCLV